MVLLDGDKTRKILILRKNKYSKKNRIKLSFMYSKLCKLLNDQGIDVIISTISLFKQIDKWNRKNIRGYKEIFLDISLDKLKKRDSKQIYARKRYSNKPTVGIDIIPDFPKNPHVLIYPNKVNKNQTFNFLLNQLKIK